MQPRKSNASSKRPVLLLAAVAMLSACSLETDVTQPSAVQIIQGNSQSVAASTKLPTDLGVVVVTQFGEPVGGVPVQWTVTSGGGTLDAALTLTNENGIATTGYTAGATAGTVTIHAKAGDLPIVTFTITVT
jgi:hypothetical protein